MVTSSCDGRKTVSRLRRSGQSFLFHAKAFQGFLESRPYYLLSHQEILEKFIQLQEEFEYFFSVVDDLSPNDFEAPYIPDDDDM